MDVVDLHCDLLWYLSLKGDRGIHHAEARCSYPQLKEGKVRLQALAIFTETQKGARALGMAQVKAFKKLRAGKLLHPVSSLEMPRDKGVHVIAAIENASSLLEEDEDFSLLFPRLDALIEEIGPLLYISLTWNQENRFAGGSSSEVGLKDEGKELLRHLSGKKIAIDLSHTSDATAWDILSEIDKNALRLIPIASHSNFRSLKHHRRNLPDELAVEVARRGGCLGINFVRAFLGDDVPKEIEKILDHGAKLDVQKHICLGADFFFENDLPSVSDVALPYFAPSYDTAACYPHLVSQLKIDRKLLAGICNGHVASFLQRLSCS